MLLVDTNVLVYAVDERAREHVVAREWLRDALAGTQTVGFAWLVLLGFLRLATHPAIFERPLSPEEALADVDDWLAQPTAMVVSPTERHLGLMRGLLAEAGTAGNLVNDVHLAALALEHGAAIISFDRDFGRFAGVRWSDPN